MILKATPGPSDTLGDLVREDKFESRAQRHARDSDPLGPHAGSRRRQAHEALGVRLTNDGSRAGEHAVNKRLRHLVSPSHELRIVASGASVATAAFRVLTLLLILRGGEVPWPSREQWPASYSQPDYLEHQMAEEYTEETTHIQRTLSDLEQRAPDKRCIENGKAALASLVSQEAAGELPEEHEGLLIRLRERLRALGVAVPD